MVEDWFRPEWTRLTPELWDEIVAAVCAPVSREQAESFLAALPADAPEIVAPGGFKGRPRLIRCTWCRRPMAVVDSGALSEYLPIVHIVQDHHDKTACRWPHARHENVMLECLDCGATLGTYCECKLSSDEVAGVIAEHEGGGCPVAAPARVREVTYRWRGPRPELRMRQDDPGTVVMRDGSDRGNRFGG